MRTDADTACRVARPELAIAFPFQIPTANYSSTAVQCHDAQPHMHVGTCWLIGGQ